jgi:hypothetical protein
VGDGGFGGEDPQRLFADTSSSAIANHYARAAPASLEESCGLEESQAPDAAGSMRLRINGESGRETPLPLPFLKRILSRCLFLRRDVSYLGFLCQTLLKRGGVLILLAPNLERDRAQCCEDRSKCDDLTVYGQYFRACESRFRFMRPFGASPFFQCPACA